MDTNKATMDEGLESPGSRNKMHGPEIPGHQLEPGLGPRIIPIVTRFGYLIKFGCNNKKIAKMLYFLID